jgi:hypothetical protein
VCRSHPWASGATAPPFAVRFSRLPGVDLSVWSNLMTGSALRGEHWLLAYEARIKGWLPSRDGSDYIAADPCFAWMRSENVSFYNAGAPAGIPDEMLEPEAAWEDAYS